MCGQLLSVTTARVNGLVHYCCIRLHSPMCFLAQFADYSVPIKVNSSKIVNLLRKKLLLKEVTTGMMSWLHR